MVLVQAQVLRNSVPARRYTFLTIPESLRSYRNMWLKMVVIGGSEILRRAPWYIMGTTDGTIRHSCPGAAGRQA